MFVKMLLYLCLFWLPIVFGGIEVPRENCQWQSGGYGEETQCDGNQVIVGACGAGRYADCPDESWHQILCCSMPNYVYENCQKYGSDHGQLNSCLDHGNVPRLLEGKDKKGIEILDLFLTFFGPFLTFLDLFWTFLDIFWTFLTFFGPF